MLAAGWDAYTKNPHFKAQPRPRAADYFENYFFFGCRSFTSAFSPERSSVDETEHKQTRISQSLYCVPFFSIFSLASFVNNSFAVKCELEKYVYMHFITSRIVRRRTWPLYQWKSKTFPMFPKNCSRGRRRQRLRTTQLSPRSWKERHGGVAIVVQESHI